LLALRMNHNCCADCAKRDRNGRKKHALHELPPLAKVAMCDDDRFFDRSSAGSLENSVTH
jgi:hypothetical protein